jgi:hypothetical protein
MVALTAAAFSGGNINDAGLDVVKMVQGLSFCINFYQQRFNDLFPWLVTFF